MGLRVALALSLAAGMIRAQTPPNDSDSLRFEVAAIKPGAPGGRGGMARRDPGGEGYRGNNLPLKIYIAAAYRMKPDQVTGAPDWVETDNFDILAEVSKPAALDEMDSMMRTLLAERFHLQFHWDTKSMPAYILSMESGGPRLTPHNAVNGGETSLKQGMEAPFHAGWKAWRYSLFGSAWRWIGR